VHSGNLRAFAFSVAVAAVGTAATFTASPAAASQCGMASWYSMGSQTASGERMNADALAAAHRSLPFGTRVKVENLDNGRSVVVRINDRGPFVAGRVIDVTRGAAQQLGMIGTGLAEVRVTVLEGGTQLNGCV
jgi:rare lipoprotein A